MPNRIIHERANTSETLASLDDGAERHFWRLIVQADDYGYLDARPEVIRARAYPMMLEKVDEAESERRTQALAAADLLHLYTADNKRYGHFPTWDKYQQKRAKYSKFPRVQSCDGICNQTIAYVPEKRETRNEKRDIRNETSRQAHHPKTPPPSSGSELLGRFSEEERQQLQATFAGVDLLHEADRCVLWWKESNKPIQRPKSALTNWLERAKEHNNGRLGTSEQLAHGRSAATGLEQTREYLSRPLPPI